MIRLERIARWPRLKRPEEWLPQRGERCWFAQGGPYRIQTARILSPPQDGRVMISIPGGTHGARLMDAVPLSRLWPWRDWEAQQAAFAREDLTAGDDR